MVSFKDVVAQDIGLFLNAEEFAEPLDIDGREVTAVLDQVLDSKTPLAYAEGVSLVTHVLFVSETELGRAPGQNQWLVINDARYRVDRVGEDMGMLTIWLEAYVT
ncbi:hypothetical protein A8L34_22490 [Bacillus sp. FJAT-27264]|nr:hypothetical protein A8L34_22490 [Bacillus sp. FJAT-27264]